MGLLGAPNDDVPTEARADQPAAAGLHPRRPRGWLRRNWWIVLIVAVAIVAFLVQLGIRVRHSVERADVYWEAQPLEGALGPFDWGHTFSDKNGPDQYWLKITVQAPIVDNSDASMGIHRVSFSITVENASQSDANVWADDFVLWQSTKVATFWSSYQPLHPVEGTVSDSPRRTQIGDVHPSLHHNRPGTDRLRDVRGAPTAPPQTVGSGMTATYSGGSDQPRRRPSQRRFAYLRANARIPYSKAHFPAAALANREDQPMSSSRRA